MNVDLAEAVAVFGEEELVAAETLLGARAAIKRFSREKADAKALLIKSLGGHNVGLLPDGRTVRRSTTEVPEATIVRAGYTSIVLDID